MTNTKIYRSILTCLACGALLCAPLSAARRHSRATRATPQAFSAQEFVNTVAQEQMLQVNLSKMVLTHSADVGVRHLTTQISDKKTDDYRKLGLIASKLNLTIPKAIDGDGNGTISKLGKLYRAEFDRAFVNAEADSTQHEIDAFERAAKEAQDPSLKQFAAAQLPDLKLYYLELKDFGHYHLKER